MAMAVAARVAFGIMLFIKTILMLVVKDQAQLEVSD